MCTPDYALARRPSVHADSHHSSGTQWMEVDGVHFHAKLGQSAHMANALGLVVGFRLRPSLAVQPRNSLNGVSQPPS